MTTIRPEETEAAVAGALELTEELFLRLARAVEALAVQVEAGEVPVETDMKKKASALRDANALLLKERDRTLEQRKYQTGSAGGSAIDFGAAKSEIRRKLGLLRTARQSGDVPE